MTAVGSRDTKLSGGDVARASGTVTFSVAPNPLAIAAGADFAVAIRAGTASAWGWNRHGELGTGSFASSLLPQTVAGGKLPLGATIAKLSSGLSHTVALGSDDAAYAWGINQYGQLGNGSTANATSPVAVAAPAGVTFSRIAAGGFHTVALGSDGALYAWGWNASGRLGNGGTADAHTPVAVSRGAIPAGVKIVGLAAGADATIALGDNGKAYTWGYGGEGQLGDGKGVSSNVPVEVAMPAGVTFTQVAAGADHMLALAKDGTVYAWGSNDFGQLGDGSLTARATPVAVLPGAVPTGTKIVRVAAGPRDSALITDAGALYTWGSNVAGQLGNGTTTDARVPVAVGALAGSIVNKVVIGSRFMLAETNVGTRFAWGAGASGRLGNGTADSRFTPSAVSSGG